MSVPEPRPRRQRTSTNTAGTDAKIPTRSGERGDGTERHEVLSRSRSVPYPRLLVSEMLVLAVGVYLALTLDDLLQRILTAIFAVGQTLPWIALFVISRRRPWAVKVDPDGVTWSDGGFHLPWSDVAELRVVHSHRVPLPWRVSGLRLVSHAEADFAARASTRPAGYLIDTSQVQATSEQVLTAISQFVQVPVIDE